MQVKNFNLFRFDADEGMVFDWKEPRYIKELIDPEKGESEDNLRVVGQEHLYAKTVFIGSNDTIDNYVEVVAPTEEE